MTTSTHILVPLDGSTLARQALPFARALVGATGRITLLWVTAKPSPIRDAAGVEIVPENIADEWMQKEARSYLDDVARDMHRTLQGDADIVARVSSGDPAAAILRTADELHADLIVMTSHARGAMGRAAFGSVADRISRNAEIPVVIARPEHLGPDERNGHIKGIIVPLDGSELAAEAIPVAKAIAIHLEIPVRLVHVIETINPYLATTDNLMTQSILDEWDEEARKTLEPIAADLRQSNIDVKVEIYQGSPYGVLSSISAPGELIVMTSHGRSGFTRWLLGSVAEKLVRSASAPVCLVPARRKTSNTSGQESPANPALILEL